MLVGLIAGLLAFGFARLFGETPLEGAIAYEDQSSAAQGEAKAMPMVSREVQRGIGLFTGVVVFGVALGGLFGLAFACAQGRLGGLGPRALAAVLAGTGYLVIVLVPALKY